ncbi:MAG: HEPN domain-containing protein [bacterium]
MNSESIKLMQLRMERAEETLADAKKLLSDGSLRSAVNRFYYAILYAARAILALKRLDSAKHSGVISLFNKEFVKTGELPKEYGRIIGNVFNRRIEGDYSDIKTFSHEEVNDIAEDCEKFVSVIMEYLKQYIEKGGARDE